MGSNTLTGLIPILYSALDVVSREQVGVLPAMTLDATASRAAKGETVTSFVAPAVTASDITPGVTPPDDGDQTIGSLTMTITKARRVPIRWNGEDTKGVNNGGPGQAAIQVAQVAQAVRTLVNEMETDAASLYSTFSRAYGTVGSDPFASDLSDPAQMRKILVDNGAPLGDMQLVLNTSAGAHLRSLPNLTRVNEAGDGGALQTQGILHKLAGFDIRESAKISTPAIGTSSNTGTTNTTGYAIGVTAITLAAAGTGTILAGDIVTFTGDANKYIVAGGVASLAAGGVLTLAAPGLQVALAASAVTVTVSGLGARNMAFARTALVLAARLPALPPGKDLATDRTTITDERSGMSFEIAEYPQYRQVQWEISAAWGVKNFKPEHTAILIGK